MRRKSGRNDLCSKILFILALSCLFLPEDVFANQTISAEDCLSCHADLWRTIKTKTYVHRPVGEGDCRSCHVPGQGRNVKGLEASRDKVKWAASVAVPGREHWLGFEGPGEGGALLIEARAGGLVKTQEFPLPAFAAIEELPVSPVPPVISNVRLLEVNKGVFVSATIAWETDSPADSQVFYGVNKLNQTSMLDSQAVRNHVMILTGVQPGKTYKYKVVSVDLAGNRGESGVMSSVFEAVSPEKQEQSAQSSGKYPEVKIRFYRRGDKSFAVINADQAISVRLGIIKKDIAGASGDKPTIIRHLIMNAPAVTNTGVCYTCHDDYKRILSHPINVYPKRGMIIPPEYPTLPDGRMTCMSCHAKHASNIEFRLIKDRKEDLCRGCHQDIE